MTRKNPTSWLLLLLLVSCQSSVDEIPRLELERCSVEDSPRELLRIEDAREYRPYDVIDGVTVVPETGEFGGALLVDNCGGDPVRLEDSFGLHAGAAHVDGQVVLCSPRGSIGAQAGIWEILETGERGKDLGIGNRCASGYPSSFGFVYTREGLVQYLPGGSTRAVPSLNRPTLTWFGDAGLVRGSDGGLVVLPPRGGDAIVVEGIPRVDLVVTQGTASTWVFLANYSEPFDLSQLGFPVLYALDLASGAWFEIGEVTGNDLRSRNFASANEGLVATVDGPLRFYRASWGGSATTDLDGALGVSVIDAERVVVATATGIQLVRVPLERPQVEDEPLALEVVWSRPLEEGEPGQTSAGLPWKNVILVDGTENVWAYPLDGSEPSRFLPSLGFTESTFPSLGYTHLGEEFVTAMARDPSDPEDFWLFRNRLGGGLEVLDTDIQGAPPLDSLGFISVEYYRWTPELGRILYAVRDGNGVSVRQHVLAD